MKLINHYAADAVKTILRLRDHGELNDAENNFERGLISVCEVHEIAGYLAAWAIENRDKVPARVLQNSTYFLEGQNG